MWFLSEKSKLPDWIDKHARSFDDLMERAKELAEGATTAKHDAILQANGAFIPGATGESQLKANAGESCDQLALCNRRGRCLLRSPEKKSA